jgi:hypothetical protein
VGCNEQVARECRIVNPYRNFIFQEFNRPQVPAERGGGNTVGVNVAAFVELVGQVEDIVPPRYFVWVACVKAGSLKSSLPAMR